MSAKQINDLLDRIDALHDSLPEERRDVDWETLNRLKKEAIEAAKKMRRIFDGGGNGGSAGADGCMDKSGEEQSPVGK